jgi:hypothetical protein
LKGYAPPSRLPRVAAHVKLSVGVVAMRFEFAALPEQCGGEARIKVEASRRGACNAVGCEMCRDFKPAAGLRWLVVAWTRNTAFTSL